MNALSNLTLAEIVTQYPATANVFEQHHLDFCCGGKKTLHATCNEKGIDQSVIGEELQNEIDHLRNDSPASDAAAKDLPALVDFIITHHHAYVKKMIPVIHAHGEKVVMVHGKNHPELAEIFKHFAQLETEMTMHMSKEESVLFPYIKLMNNVRGTGVPTFGTIKNPIAMMEDEHAQAGNLLEHIQEATHNYSAPPDACITYQLYFSELQDFQKDLHQHVHLENNILFPKAIALEKELMDLKNETAVNN